jgi:hypothetical protein
MPNDITLSGLTEILYQARDIVARELVGFIPSVTINAGSEGVSIGGTVSSVVTAQPTLNTDHSPAMTIPAGDDTTISTETMTIGQKSRTNIPIKGEIAKQLANTADYGLVLEQLFVQHLRTHANAIEAHCGTVIKNGASRAIGTAGTAPFGSDFNLTADARRILVDNGCPMDGQVSLVINTAAGSNLRKLAQLQKANEAGSASMLRNGELLNLNGFSIKESAGIARHTKGTLAGSPTITNANFQVGATSLTLTAAGTGTIVTGDALSIANDTGNVYIVGTGDTDVSSGGTLILNNPGLRQATGASTRALTIAADYNANMAFHRAAVELAMRPPAQPPGGDAATERTTIFDPVSGLVFEVALYKGYGMNLLEFVCYYQAKVWKEEFVATILG